MFNKRLLYCIVLNCIVLYCIAQNNEILLKDGSGQEFMKTGYFNFWRKVCVMQLRSSVIQFFGSDKTEDLTVC